MSMERYPERELMDDEAQAIAYARADFSASNQLFVDALVRAVPGGVRHLIDLGCGPADVTIRLARALPAAAMTAVDGSDPMIALAGDAVRSAALEDRITLLRARIPGVPVPDRAFDAVVSKDLLHHLPDPAVLWDEIARLGAPGACVHVMDLVRPATRDQARRIVDRVAGDADPVLRTDFYNSLCAAFTIDEVRAQVASTALVVTVELAGDRHLLVSGRLPG